MQKGSLWTRARCGHGNVCQLHCGTCNPKETRVPAGRPRKRPHRETRAVNPSYAEQDEWEGFLESSDSEDLPLPTPPSEDALPNATTRETQSHVLALLGITSARLKNLPSLKLRESSNVRHGLCDEKWVTFVKLAKDACDGVFKLLCPNDTTALAEAVWKQMAANPAHDDAVDDVLPGMKLAAEIRRATTNGCAENRVVTALLAGTYSRKQLGRRFGISMNTTSHKQAIDDLKALSRKGGSLPVRQERRRKYEEHVVVDSLRWFLQEENICVLSWGTKMVKLSATESIVLPSLTRKKPLEMMIDDYQDVFKREDNKELSISRSSAHKILSHITNGQTRSLTAVNYMLGELIYDNFVLVDRIVSEYTAKEDHKRLKLHSLIASNFLKVQYPLHCIKEDDQVCTHGLMYGLGDPSATARTTMECNVMAASSFLSSLTTCALRWLLI